MYDARSSKEEGTTRAGIGNKAELVECRIASSSYSSAFSWLVYLRILYPGLFALYQAVWRFHDVS